VEVAGIFHRIFRRRDERSTGSVLASDPGYHVSSPEARAAPDKNSTRRSTVFPAPKSSSVVSPVLEKHRPRPLGGNSVSLQTAEARGIALRHALTAGVQTCIGVDRKSTRLNSSHVAISYAVFCLKKKN